LELIVDHAVTAMQPGEVDAEGPVVHAAVNARYEGHIGARTSVLCASQPPSAPASTERSACWSSYPEDGRVVCVKR
jgi:hypothetical protein